MDISDEENRVLDAKIDRYFEEKDRLAKALTEGVDDDQEYEPLPDDESGYGFFKALVIGAVISLIIAIIIFTCNTGQKKSSRPSNTTELRSL